MTFSTILIGGLHVQDHEFFYPLYRLREEMASISIATPGGMDTTSNKGTKIKADIAIEDAQVDEYDLLVIPGGAHAMEYLRQNQSLISFVSAFGISGKTIACICQGAQILISARLTSDKRIAGYYSLKDDIQNSGGIFTDEPAVIHGNLVTTAHYKDMGPWMKAAIDRMTHR